jgi:type II secretory pathway pseudopilin PulG
MGRSEIERDRGQLGISLAELVVVTALLALAALIVIPLTMRQINQIRIRTAADEYLVSVRAARMVAITTGQDVSFDVSVHPINSYEYLDTEGRRRTGALPIGVRIDPASTPSFVFRSNGSLAPPGSATTVLKARLPDDLIVKWTVQTPLSGIPSMGRETVPFSPLEWPP